ncbi:DNA adenine methylase [Microbacterium algeriense]|uniref:DNA adenine methylase n=1 Tax=Microbacterium algeriense TaxID=2615184 RepID=UPI00384EE37C
MTEKPATLRPIHYLGNKAKFLSPIVSGVVELTPSGRSILDLFAGSGVVSREFARHRPVVSVDIQAYSATLAGALCAPRAYGRSTRQRIAARAREWLDDVTPKVADLLEYEAAVSKSALSAPERFARLVEEGSLTSLVATDEDLARAKMSAEPQLASARAMLTSYYGGVYFSYAQALELDALLAAIRHQHEAPAEATLVAAVLGTASDLVSTVGSHFAQPSRLRDKSGAVKATVAARVLRARSNSALELFDRWLQRYASLDPAGYPCTTTTADFRAVLDTLDASVGAIYADPPYTRDHYSRFYHVLETIALGDDPGVSLAPGTSVPSRGLYRAQRHQSPFSIRSEVVGAFDSIFVAAKRQRLPLVLSYSPQGGGTKARPETRLMTIEGLVNRAEGFFTSVTVHPIAASSHSRLNRTEYNGELPAHAEVLIVARP